MLAVLLAAAGVAYLLQSYTARRAKAGSAVMGTIRSNGLGHYWSDEPATYWYTIQNGDEPIGWRLQHRVATEGGFAGVSVDVFPVDRGVKMMVAARWRLNSDLTQGIYESFALRNQAWIVTRIELAQDQVKVTPGVMVGAAPGGFAQWESPRQFSLSQTPGNYVPEGTLSLVIAQVAALRSQGGFSLIFDEEADMRQTFLRYAGEVTQDGQRFVKVLGSSMVMGRKSAEEYLLSDEGVIFQINTDHETQAMSDYASILRQFGDPLPLVQPWLLPEMRVLGEPLPAPAAPTAPARRGAPMPMPGTEQLEASGGLPGGELSCVTQIAGCRR